MACDLTDVDARRGSPLGIALDLGTSGLRAQALDLATSQVLSTAITLRHPLPGANVVDHVHLALEIGLEATRSLLLEGVMRVIGSLRVPLERVRRFAVCGNPVQLSLLQGLEVRDLAYPGSRKLELLGVTSPRREAVTTTAARMLLAHLPPDCEVLVPPAICRHVGADALALIIQSGIGCEESPSVAIDYGTNAEMALLYQGHLHTGSTAAGPALEGQHLACGMLAAPGAVVNLEREGEHYRLYLLDGAMQVAEGPLVDLRFPAVVGDEERPRPVGITGSGVVAAMSLAMEAGLVSGARITTADRRLHLGEALFLSEEDVAEVGRAFGAVRAGFIALCQAAGAPVAEVSHGFMAGASGTHMDPRKARHVGLLPPRVTDVHLLGNTSLAMARDLAISPTALDTMSALAAQLRDTCCLFATSDAFRKAYVLEVSHWTEGMPMSLYRAFLARYGLPDLPPMGGTPRVAQAPKPDPYGPGPSGIVTVHPVGRVVNRHPDGCTSCRRCIEACPGRAITGSAVLSLDLSLCRGLACRRCERACPQAVFRLEAFLECSSPPDPAPAPAGGGNLAEKVEA